MTNEEIYDILQLVSVIILGLTFAIGAATILYGKKVSNEQNKRMVDLQISVNQEATKRAEAEAKLLALQKNINWRILDIEKFVKILDGKPKGNVQVVIPMGDAESLVFATNVFIALQKAGWIVASPEVWVSDLNVALPFPLNAGGMIVGNKPTLTLAVSDKTVPEPFKGDSPLSALGLALTRCGYKPVQNVPYERLRPAKGVIRVIISPRI